jgi:hypothetical protein
MKSKYLPRLPGNDLMHTAQMCEDVELFVVSFGNSHRDSLS